MKLLRPLKTRPNGLTPARREALGCSAACAPTRLGARLTPRGNAAACELTAGVRVAGNFTIMPQSSRFKLSETTRSMLNMCCTVCLYVLFTSVDASGGGSGG